MKEPVVEPRSEPTAAPQSTRRAFLGALCAGIGGAVVGSLVTRWFVGSESVPESSGERRLDPKLAWAYDQARRPDEDLVRVSSGVLAVATVHATDPVILHTMRRLAEFVVENPRRAGSRALAAQLVEFFDRRAPADALPSRRVGEALRTLAR